MAATLAATFTFTGVFENRYMEIPEIDRLCPRLCRCNLELRT